MKTYNINDWTWGFELELSDVPKNFPLDPALGKWEQSECDIVNTLAPYRGICADPLGINPPVGGEINVNPTKSPVHQVMRIGDIVRGFVEAGYNPNVSPTAHNHIHVHIPGLREDPVALKRLTKYIKENQADVIEYVYGFYEHPEMKACPKGKTYLKHDGGRPIPDWKCDNIIKNTTDFDSFIAQHCAGKDGVSMGRPVRHAINMYCMKHTQTIEFRCFRGSLSAKEIMDCFNFVGDFMKNALAESNQKSVKDILFNSDYTYTFPKMQWDLELMQGWVKTKHDPDTVKGLKKNREFLDAT